jgi:hypothetical protein
MGVCLVAYTISDENLARVLVDPLLVWRVVEADDESAYLRALAASARPSLWARLLGRAKPPAVPGRLSLSPPELQTVDLDKSWGALDACIRWCAPDLPSFCQGSGRVGDVEVGYGPALYHSSSVMSRIARGLAAIDNQAMLQALQAVDLDDVYLKGWWQRRDAAAGELLTAQYAELQAFVRHAMQHSLGAILQYT